MNNGIAIYPGLDNTLEENLELITKAAHDGLTRLFTSLHIPETDRPRFKKELGLLLKKARNAGMEIISDVTPDTLNLLDIDVFTPSALKMLGITTLRLDDGFSPEKIAALSNSPPTIRLQLNASTVTRRFLSRLSELGTNFQNIDALHNFYPRPGTGLGEETLVRKNILLHRLGIQVGAFVPSLARPRGPIHAGLPTLEEHRTERAELAARHLVALGCDSIFLADSMPTTKELREIGELPGDQVTITCQSLTTDPIQNEMLKRTYTSRLDEARDAVRATESRAVLKELGGTIHRENAILRPIGAITIDNEGYGRYMGELQIARVPLEADARTNVAALVEESEVNLIQYITPGRRFAFRMTQSRPDTE